jgi:hypothetical protein
LALREATGEAQGTPIHAAGRRGIEEEGEVDARVQGTASRLLAIAENMQSIEKPQTVIFIRSILFIHFQREKKPLFLFKEMNNF